MYFPRKMMINTKFSSVYLA